MVSMVICHTLPFSRDNTSTKNTIAPGLWVKMSMADIGMCFRDLKRKITIDMPYNTAFFLPNNNKQLLVSKIILLYKDVDESH